MFCFNDKVLPVATGYDVPFVKATASSNPSSISVGLPKYPPFASNVSVYVSFLNFISQILLSFIPEMVSTSPFKEPAQVFSSSSFVYPGFGVTLNVSVPLYLLVLLTGAETTPVVPADKETAKPSLKFIVQ